MCNVSESTLLCYDNKCLDDYTTSLCRRKCGLSLIELDCEEAEGTQVNGGGEQDVAT